MIANAISLTTTRLGGGGGLHWLAVIHAHTGHPYPRSHPVDARVGSAAWK